MAISIPRLQTETLKLLFARREVRLGLVLAAVFVLGAGYLLFFSQDPEALQEPITPLIPESARSVKPLTFDLSILDDERFLRLKTFGNLPIVVPEKGRNDPFAPF